jgi:sugar phosphate isomerase/epimerase
MKRLFRLGTTSFIYPDHILPNVRKIGALFDEIELLVFESIPETVLPDKTDIDELAALSRDLDVGYNIHLPTDISLTHGAPHHRQKAADTIARVVALCEPLAPSTHTLHLEMGHPPYPDGVTAWQDRALDGLNRLMPRLPGPGILSVETLDYPPDCLIPLLAAHDLTVCIDIGHHFRYGYDPAHSFDIFKDRVALVHLHGVTCSDKGIKDHTSLDRLNPGDRDRVRKLLQGYGGTVSLEVFNRQDLNRSLAVLSAMFDDIPLHLPA